VKTPSGECTNLLPGTIFTVYVVTKGIITQSGESVNSESAHSVTFTSITGKINLISNFKTLEKNRVDTPLQINWTNVQNDLNPISKID
jgi:aspartate carbamoyltransferase regulatory subunit